MYTVYFIFFQVASATATKFGLSRGLLGLQYDQINASESESESVYFCIFVTLHSIRKSKQSVNSPQIHGLLSRHVHVVFHFTVFILLLLEWTTSLDTSSRTLFVREGGREDVHVTSSYVITYHCSA